MADKHTGEMKVLTVMSYKDCPIYVRMIGKSTFIWDVIFENQLYSSYMVITPGKGRKRLNTDEIAEVAKMCFAGASATVDTKLGIKLSDTDEAVFKRFEQATQLVGSN